MHPIPRFEMLDSVSLFTKFHLRDNKEIQKGATIMRMGEVVMRHHWSRVMNEFLKMEDRT